MRVALLLVALSWAVACNDGDQPERTPVATMTETPTPLPAVRTETPTPTATLTVTPQQAPATPATGPQSVADIAERAGQSVVRVNIYLRGSDRQQELGSGSGWVFDRGGHIVTNYHVAAPPVFGEPGEATELTVTTYDGRELAASIVGLDPRTDLALLRVEGLDLDALPLGRLEDARIGDPVVAIGYALDLGDSPSVTTGVISAKERQIQEATTIFGALQTDAAINPGNSGGPLLNLSGEVLGVNTAINAAAQGIGFAVSVETVRAVADELVTKGHVDRGFIGIEFEEVTPAMAREFSLPVDEGVRVEAIAERSPADRAGLKPGDVLTRVAEKEIRASSDLMLSLIGHPPGERIQIELYRDGAAQTLELTLGEIPSSPF